IENDYATLVFDEYVRRLEIAMNPSVGVHRVHALDELPEREPQAVDAFMCAFTGLRVRSDVPHEIHPADELHREAGMVAVADDELVEAYEVFVPDIRERPKFALEAIERLRVERLKHLQCDGMTPFAVEGLIDDAHSAFAELVDDPVALTVEPTGADALAKRAR